jgi:predicted Rossmann fold flavoprotein
MDVSGRITAAESLTDVQLIVDLVPDISEEQLRTQLTDRSVSGGRSPVAALLGRWLPNRLAAAMTAQCGCECTVAELPRGSAFKLIEMIKGLKLPVTGTRGFEKAEVTAGGVACAEVDPRTMASRIAENLFIAGEVLDVDGWIGGYNFQAAFSTGRAAGIAAAGE